MEQERKSRWSLTRKQALVAAGIVALLLVLVLIGYRYGITLWDWLELLIVPAVLAGGGLWFNQQQRERELASHEAQREREREISNQRRDHELEIENQRAQDVTLQAYIDQMERLLIDHRLRSSQPKDDVRVSARARTLTVLERLDASRKRSIVRFLYEADLIKGNQPVVGLRDADLRGAHLMSINLSSANLGGADLSRTKLKRAKLASVNVTSANLLGADLAFADLEGANLEGANRGHDASMSGDHLKGTRLENKYKDDPSRPKVKRAYPPATVLIEANLRGANLRGASLWGSELLGADLRGADLRGADLRETDLSSADLREADLSGSYLTDAYLSGAKVTDEQLATCESLQGAIMPDGSVHD